MGTAAETVPELNARGLRLALVASRYNLEVCDGLVRGALQELQRLGLKADEVPVFRVPGAFELPFLAKSLAESGKVDGVICLGTVIRGETAHFDYVCQGTTQGIQLAMLDTGIPIAFGVLTTDTLEQALARAGEDSHNKGLEAAQTAVEMILLKKRIKT